MVLEKLTDLVEKARKAFGEKVWEELERTSTDIDNADIDLKNLMLEKNIAISTSIAEKISEMPREPWIGKRYSYQLPAYHYTLKAMARKKSYEIEFEEIIRETISWHRGA